MRHAVLKPLQVVSLSFYVTFKCEIWLDVNNLVMQTNLQLYFDYHVWLKGSVANNNYFLSYAILITL